MSEFCNFAGLIISTENDQKNFQCNCWNQWSIRTILKSFYQILLTWSKTYIGSFDHTVCICPSGDKYLLSEEPYFNCTLPQLNPCTEDPCGNKAVCVAAQGGNAICICPFGYSGDPYVNCVKDF